MGQQMKGKWTISHGVGEDCPKSYCVEDSRYTLLVFTGASARSLVDILLAAPELLSALERLVAQVEFKDKVPGGVGPFADAADRARAVIAKATRREADAGN